jgi:excisionase family DNA binding protein
MKGETEPTRIDQLMTIEEVASYMQVPVKTLYDWRHRSIGPRGMRVGRYVRYRRDDVDAWLESCRDPDPPLATAGPRKAS